MDAIAYWAHTFALTGFDSSVKNLVLVPSFTKMFGFLILSSLFVVLAASLPVSRQVQPQPAVDAPPPSCAIAEEIGEYLNMEPMSMFKLLSRNEKIGSCMVVKGNKGDPCPFYVRVETETDSKLDGWPYSSRMQSSGCVMTAAMIQKNSGCMYKNSSFGLHPRTSRAICTSDVIQNTVSQVKHAISEGVCKIQVKLSGRQICNPITCECIPGPPTGGGPRPGNPGEC